MLKQHNIRFEFEYVPQYKLDPEWPSIWWTYTLYCQDHPVLTSTFKQGLGYLKHHEFITKRYNITHQTQIFEDLLQRGIEGKIHYDSFYSTYGPKLTPPSPDDVMYCLLSDTDVMNYTGFEDWATSFGYNPDSIKAKKIFDQCVDLSMKLSIIPSGILDVLREHYSDY